MLFSKTKLLNQEYEESNTFCPVVVFVYASDNNFKISEQEGTQDGLKVVFWNTVCGGGRSTVQRTRSDFDLNQTNIVQQIKHVVLLRLESVL